MPEIRIDISNQELTFNNENGECRYPVSTSIKGTGEKVDSGKTPLGKHIVRAKIGAGLPINSVFVGRRPTGEICTPQLFNQHPDRDWILSRILWLSGTEPGFNRLGDVDTMRRFIYIHGTAHEDELGKAVSHGCIRMANQDVMELFNLTPLGCPVDIVK